MPTTLRMNDDIEKRYSHLAEITGRSKAFYFNRALENSIDRLEYDYGLLKDVEDFKAGIMKTYSLDEVRKHCGLDD